MPTATLETPETRIAPELEQATSMGAPASFLRRAFSFPVMLFGWIVLMVVRLAETNLPDPDIWWHLRDAQYLFARHQVPHFDTYSFSVAGHPWMNTEWLAEIPYYLAWRAFGLEGIEILMLLVLEAIFLGVLYLCYQRTGHIKASVLACWAALALGTANFGPRTVLFGYLYLVVLLAILERFRSKGRAPLWLLPALLALWINCHGSWCLGLAVFAVVIASGFVEGQWGLVRASRWTPRQLRQLLMAFAVCCAALFLNPYGYRLVLFPLDMALRQRQMVASIAEWAQVDFHGPRGVLVLVLLGVLFGSVLFTRRRWLLSDFVLMLMAFYGGLSHDRLLFFAGIVTAPLLAEVLELVPRYRPDIDKPVLNAAIILGIVAFVVWRFPGPGALQEQVAEQYPAEIISYFQEHKPSGRVLNYFDWGGYLGWRDPEIKDFVDGRMDLFEYPGVFQDYLDLMGFRRPLDVLDEYQIRYVLFPPHAPLAYLLRRDPNWKVDFDGKVSALLERVGPMPAGLPKDATLNNQLQPW